MSVAAAASRISTPSTSKWIGNPQKSKLGWRVSSTTTSSGTKKIRRVVKLLGRFMKSPEKPRLAGQRAFQRFDSQYSGNPGESTAAAYSVAKIAILRRLRTVVEKGK